MAQIHNLILYPAAFRKILEERESYAIRGDKEGVQKGDRILFHERDDAGNLRRMILTEVIDIIDHTTLGLPTGYTALGVQVFQKGGVHEKETKEE